MNFNRDYWFEIIEAREREQRRRDLQAARTIKWTALVFIVLFIVVCAMWAKLT